MGWGAVAAPIIGQLAGSALGSALGGKQQKAGIDMAMVNARRGEIDQFAKGLESARGKYSTALGNMYNSAFQRFIPAQQARVAARGLSMGGGAYNASLGREVARYQSEMEPQIYQAEREDLGKIDGARGGLFGSVFGAQNEANMYNVGQANKGREQFMGMMSNIGGSVGGGMYNAGMLGGQAAWDQKNLGRAALPEEIDALSSMGRGGSRSW